MTAQTEAPAKPADDLRHNPDAGLTVPGGYSVADLCRRWKVGADKVHGFLRRGELVGVNLASNLCGRPQWRITPESVRLFEKRRSSAPPSKPPRRGQPQLVDYWPD